MSVLSRLRAPTLPLPPIRETSDILSDLDHQVGRLAVVRDRAVELLSKMEEEGSERS